MFPVSSKQSVACWSESFLHIEGEVSFPCPHHEGIRGNRAMAPFLTPALNGSEWFTSCPGYFTLGKNVSTHWTCSWVGPRAGLVILENLNLLLLLRF